MSLQVEILKVLFVCHRWAGYKAAKAALDNVLQVKPLDLASWASLWHQTAEQRTRFFHVHFLLAWLTLRHCSFLHVHTGAARVNAGHAQRPPHHGLHRRGQGLFGGGHHDRAVRDRQHQRPHRLCTALQRGPPMAHAPPAHQQPQVLRPHRGTRFKDSQTHSTYALKSYRTKLMGLACCCRRMARAPTSS